MGRYPKSRLPGPAVRLFDLEAAQDPDPEATVARNAHHTETVVAPPDVEWVLTEECRPSTDRRS